MKYNFVKLLQTGGVTNTSNSGTFDRNAVNQSYLDVYKDIFSNQDFNIDDYNSFLRTYYGLRNGSKYSGDKAIKYDGTADYQNRFNQFGFHTNPFMSGWAHTNKPLADSGDNFDTGAWKKADNYFGAITNERRANYFSDDELVAQNNLAKNYGLKWELDTDAGDLDAGSGRKYYKLTRLSNANQEPPAGDPKEEPTNKNLNPADLPLNPPDRLPWTDLIPITAQATNNWLSAVRQANLQKLMGSPLEEAKHRQYKIDNDYHLRTSIQQNANELRDVTAYQSNSSDMRHNLNHMMQANTQAMYAENQAEAGKADRHHYTQEKALDTANFNNDAGVTTRNNNAITIEASKNNIINANQQLSAQKAAIANDWIDKTATSYGQNVLDNRLNQQAYQRSLIDQTAAIAQQKAYDEYLNASDYKNSEAYKSLLAEITAAGQEAGGSGKEIPGLDWTAYDDENKREAELERFWNSDSELAGHYRTLFGKELEQAEKNLMNKYQLIGNRKAAYSLQLPYRLNNQGFYIPWSFTTPTFRKGGSVGARFIDYQNHTQRDQHNALKSSQRRSEQRQKALDKQLDRLSKEQLLLLRSIFK